MDCMYIALNGKSTLQLSSHSFSVLITRSNLVEVSVNDTLKNSVISEHPARAESCVVLSLRNPV